MKTLYDVLTDDCIPAQLKSILKAITQASKVLSERISLGVFGGVLGSAEQENIQGETQKNLDVLANDLLKVYLAKESAVAALASEEEEGVVACHQDGKYVVAFDPLDGSSNIDINGQIGTIFTVYPRLNQYDYAAVEQFLQPGSQQVCAGYVLYGPATQLVLCTGGATRSYTLVTNVEVLRDAGLAAGSIDLAGEYLLADNTLSIPQETGEFAVNMAHQTGWSEWAVRYISDLVLGVSGPREKTFNMRWNGAMVGDVHRILLRGGIFLYPLNRNNPQCPAKLRLLYEANPMAMLVKGAGGLAYSQGVSMLDVTPQTLNQRVEVILGSAAEVERCLAYRD